MNSGAVRPVDLLMNPLHALALGCGAGCAPKAPGTFGTLVGVLLYLALRPLPLVVYLLVVSAGFMIGIYLCGRTAAALGRHDHPAIVWDEIIGYLVTMTAAPGGWWWLLIGFGLFRAFDIFKPWPIKAVDQRVGGGSGIMLDDLLAALFAFLVIQVTSYFL